MTPDIVDMVWIMLLESHTGQDFWDGLGKDIIVIEQNALDTIPHQHLHEFIPLPLHRDPFQIVYIFSGSKLCVGINGEVQRSSKTDCSHYPKGILLESLPGVTNTPDNPISDILLAIKWVNEPGYRAPRNGVDGKIPAGQVGLHIGAKLYGIGVPAISIFPVLTKCRHLIAVIIAYNRYRSMFQPSLNNSVAQAAKQG